MENLTKNDKGTYLQEGEGEEDSTSYLAIILLGCLAAVIAGISLLAAVLTTRKW